MRHLGVLGVVFGLGLFVVAVESVGQPPPPHSPPPRLGQPLAGLGPVELGRFEQGKTVFLEPEDVPGGLGPVFTESSCAKCHGGPAATGGSGARLVTRVGRLVNGQYDPLVEFGGPLIQDHGIGRFNGVNFIGEVVPPQATIVARRRTVPLFGLGLVDALPDEALIAHAQYEHLAHPLIAGRPSVVVDPATGQERVGKFGWKGQQPTVFAFCGDAYANEMGVTTPLFPSESCPQGNCQLLAANPALQQPNDATNATVQALADFVALLAPAPTGPVGSREKAGEAVFGAIGCAVCHQATWQTGPGPIPALNHVAFSPYSDFLLHDMGSLGDGIVQAAAGPREMRTAPLWGMRFETSYLHDGRARTPADAILAHDGQARPARDRFAALSPAARAQLLAFLNSL